MTERFFLPGNEGLAVMDYGKILVATQLGCVDCEPIKSSLDATQSLLTHFDSLGLLSKEVLKW